MGLFDFNFLFTLKEHLLYRCYILKDHSHMSQKKYEDRHEHQ
jgi:hypothetical protein